MYQEESMQTIGEVINQQQFKSEFIKADINLSYTSTFLSREKNSVLKEYGISVQQFNILRILKGMNGNPASVKLLTERMIDKMSNASRLVDRLINKGLVERRRCKQDRRQVDIFITNEGKELINKASQTLEALISDNQSISEDEAKELNRILDKMRKN